jgi:hypothetical protein
LLQEAKTRSGLRQVNQGTNWSTRALVTHNKRPMSVWCENRHTTGLSVTKWLEGKADAEHPISCQLWAFVAFVRALVAPCMTPKDPMQTAKVRHKARDGTERATGQPPWRTMSVVQQHHELQNTKNPPWSCSVRQGVRETQISSQLFVAPMLFFLA